MTETFVRATTTLYHLTIAGSVVTTTDEHPFMVQNMGWILARDLQPGDILVTPDTGDGTGTVTLDRIDVEQRDQNDPVIVYNFHVATHHNYYVLAGTLPVFVHNSGAHRPPKKIDNVNFGSRGEAEFAARQRAGIDPDATPDEVWAVGDDVLQRGKKGYRYSTDQGSHGQYQQFETESGSRVIANHTNDPNAPAPHFHAGQPKSDPSRDGVNFGWGNDPERYQQVGGKHHYYYPEG